MWGKDTSGYEMEAWYVEGSAGNQTVDCVIQSQCLCGAAGEGLHIGCRSGCRVFPLRLSTVREDAEYGTVSISVIAF